MQMFYAHGKLMLTGEYVALDGAESLAIPTRQGQFLRVKKLSDQDNFLYWIALDFQRKIWLNFTFDKANLHCINEANDKATQLSAILLQAKKMNPAFLSEKDSIAVETSLEFPNEWGLGSSSTLIANIAKWANVNAYELLQATLGGSGYDVFCAENDTPILFSRKENTPKVSPINYFPAFADNIYFVYSGKKQLSTAGIKYYNETVKDKTTIAKAITAITKEILACNDLTLLENLIAKHEEIISNALHLPKVKDTIFADLDGCAKSLGAWGGDFMMITSKMNKSDLYNYLKTKEISIFFTFSEMIFKNK